MPGILRDDGQITKIPVFGCVSLSYQTAKEPEIAYRDVGKGREPRAVALPPVLIVTCTACGTQTHADVSFSSSASAAKADNSSSLVAGIFWVL